MPFSAISVKQLTGRCGCNFRSVLASRYRKLSTLVHPDKRLDMPQARDAFEEVKKAYQVRFE